MTEDTAGLVQLWDVVRCCHLEAFGGRTFDEVVELVQEDVRLPVCPRVSRVSVGRKGGGGANVWEFCSTVCLCVFLCACERAFARVGNPSPPRSTHQVMVPNWLSVDTKTGVLTVHLDQPQVPRVVM